MLTFVLRLSQDKSQDNVCESCSWLLFMLISPLTIKASRFPNLNADIFNAIFEVHLTSGFISHYENIFCPLNHSDTMALD